MKLINILKESEDRTLSNEVKKHFLEIVSTYNKYQESMDRKSDIIQVAETLGGITEAARELALRESDDWFDKHTIKRNMGELTKLGAQFDKVAKEARGLDQRMNSLYEDMGNILSRYYKIGEITEDEMKSRLGIKESKGDCGCGCEGTTPGGCGDKSVNEESVSISTRDDKGTITTRIKEENELNEEEKALYEFGLKVEKMIVSEKSCPNDPGKWAASKAAAKKKFDVYPSAYANGWAAKNYKSKGGTWKNC
tara:strand:- start:1663 stop:2418 length:756 start_codon:yes stop_codon:yes gene_type:complete